MSANSVGILVGIHNRHCRVPSQVLANALFDFLIAGKPWLLLDRNRVDVRRRHLSRCADLKFTCTLSESRH